MNVIVHINSRQAVPVRAIPLLTDWKVLSPDQVAKILSGDVLHWASFEGLKAYRLHHGGSAEQIQPRWWKNWIVRKLQATSDEIKAKQTSHETGYQQWRREALAQLPHSVFVWCDEFEAAYVREFGPGSLRARFNPETFDPNAHVLNFNPQSDQDIAPLHLVLEGFESNEGGPVADSASAEPGNGKVWTSEKLAELKAYRMKYGTKKTAEHYQVSEARIRRLLPGEKPKPKGYSAFTHRIK